MFIVGLSLFTVASVAVGPAQTEAWLIATRAAQGVGAAILAPTTLALLTTTFPEGPERTRSVSLDAAVAVVGATLGLVAGGTFAGWLSGRVGLFVNAPIGIALILAAARYLPGGPAGSMRADTCSISGGRGPTSCMALTRRAPITRA